MKILRTGGSPPAIDSGRDAVPDLESRFQALIRSPLRAGLLRYLHARPEHWFDVQSLMAAFDCMRLDGSNYLTGLVEFGVVRRARNDAPAYSATWPTRPAAAALLRAFLDERELEDTVARAAGAARGPVIDAKDLPLPASDPRSPTSAGALLPTLRDAERVHIGYVLDAVRWNKKEAARVLDISRGTLYRKIQEYALDPRAGAARVRPELTSGAFGPGLGSGA